MAENSVGHANSFVHERKVRVQFDSPLIQGERCLRVAGQKELGSLECPSGVLPGMRSSLFPEAD